MFKTLQILGFAISFAEIVMIAVIFLMFMPEEFEQPSRLSFYLEVILYPLTGLAIYTAARMMSTRFVRKDIQQGNTEAVRMQMYQKWYILRLCVLEAVIMAAACFFIIIPIQSLIYIAIVVFISNILAVKTAKTAEAEYRNIVEYNS